MITANDILALVPHQRPYRFVDEIVEVDESHIIGRCHLPAASTFYEGHFPDNPVTPGFVITEIMAQIGILCLGIYLVNEDFQDIKTAFLSSADVKFLNVCYPDDTITVYSRKIYFRMNKIKCHIEAINQHGNILCSGEMTGLIQLKPPINTSDTL